MAKLIELKEAAEQLGISPEALTELVDQKKIFGYRDGASWKFKPTELDRVASQLDLSSGASGAAEGVVEAAKDQASEVAETMGLVPSDDDEMIDVDELQLDDAEEDDDEGSILISEEELGRSEEGTSSTIIGQATGDNAADSDIRIAEDGDNIKIDEGSDLELASTSDLKIDGGSDLQIATEEDESSALDGGSELSLAAESGEGSDLTPAGDSNLSLAEDSDPSIAPASAGASDVLAGDSDLLSLDEGSDANATAESGIDLSLEESSASSAESSLTLGADDELSLDDDELSLDASGIGSSISAADSGIELDLDDDDLLAGSGVGSDITLGASDSGINLTNPSDSGISLEDVGSDIGSGIDSSLELSDEVIEMDEVADADDATELQTEDEFMLTPVAGDADLDEESDDSGSQVIALDGEEFDESAATMLVPDDEDPFAEAGEDEFGDAAVGVAATSTAGAAAAAAAAVGEEDDFSVWNIVGLGMLAFFMMICGLLAMDVLRNIWTWNQPFGLSGTLMDLIVGS